MRLTRLAGVMGVLALASRTTAAPAQERATVRAAIRLAGEGRSDSARSLLNGELARNPPGGPAYIEALYWRGRLASSGESAERDFRRVAIEFSTSPWADDALLQLAQLNLAGGNAAGAYESAMRLRSDYPDSELRSHAALWAARAAFVTGEPMTACALLDTARVEAATDVEFVNQVDFYRGRCIAMVAAQPPAAAPARAPAGATPRDTAAAASSRGFEVQVAAARTEEAARAVVDRLTRAGHQAHVVTGEDGLRRVRLGPYATREQADEAARAARRITGGSPFVVRQP